MMFTRLPVSQLALLAGATLGGAVALAALHPNDSDLARQFEADGDQDLAIRHWRAWVRTHPTDRGARLRLVDLLAAAPQPQYAVAELERMAAEYPQDTALLERLLSVEQRMHRTERVVEVLEALATARPQSVETLRWLAEAYRFRQDDKKLFQTLTRLVHSSDSAQACAELSRHAWSSARGTQRVDLLRTCVRQHPDNVRMRVLVYDALLAAGNTRAAAAELRALSKMAVRSNRTAAVGDLLAEQERLPEAIAVYERGLEKAPETKALIRRLGDALELSAEKLIAVGDRVAAVRLLRQHIDRHPTALDLRLRLANLYGRDSEQIAISEIRSLLRHDDSNADAWLMLGQRLSWHGDLREAAQALTRSLALKPSPETRRLLARHLYWTSQHSKAVPLLKAVVADAPTRVDVAALAGALVEKKRPAEAMQYITPLVQQHPRNPSYRRLLAEAALTSADCPAAAAQIRWLTARSSDASELWARLGLCAITARNDALASEALGHVKHNLTLNRNLRARE